VGSSSYVVLIANFESISPDRAGFLMQIARIAKVPVIMDAGGAEGPIPEELLKFVTVLSPNETELARLTGMPTKSLEDVIDAAAKIQEMVSFWPFILHAESHFCLHSHGTEKWSGQRDGLHHPSTNGSCFHFSLSC
jgi:sugar/nucleoside kinase (ribokinase family)